MIYILVGENDDILDVRQFRQPLEPFTFNDEESAKKNGKPYLAPVIPAELPPGHRVVSRAFAREGSAFREVLVTEAIPTPPSAPLSAEELYDMLVAKNVLRAQDRPRPRQ